MATGRIAQNSQLTKADTVALWHAVSNFELMVKQMESLEGVTPEQIEGEKNRLSTAKRALRKVNKLREQRSPASAQKGTFTQSQSQEQESEAPGSDVPRTAYGYKQKPLTLNMLLSLHHLLAGRKNPKYRAFYMGCWGLRERGLATDKHEVTDLGRKVALENASVMAQFDAGKIPHRMTTR